MTSLRTAAVRYASLGYGVVPLYWVLENGRCSCGDPDCRSVGKHPINTHGASDPFTDPEDVALQWEQLPDANIGLVPGTNRWLVVDLDGEHALDRFRSIADTETLDRIKNAPVVKTGKGWHLILADPNVEFGPSVGKDEDRGIDIRAGVSLIVAPPSHHVSGTDYRWVKNPPPFDPPQPTRWLRNYILTRKSEEAKTIIDEDVKVAEGSRNDTMTELGGVMRRRGFSEAEIRAALILANQRINNPPLDEREIGSIAHSLAGYSPSDVPDSIRVAATSTSELLERLQELDTRHLVEDAPPIIDWVWEDYLAPGTLNMLHGDGGLGKSYLSLKIAEQMLQSDGGELFGRKIHHGGVVILDGENAESQIHHRIHTTMIRADSPLRIFTLAEPILGYEEKTQSIFDWIAEEHDPRLVIVDSQRALWAGDEKEQMEVGRMLRRLAKGLEELPYAVLLLHHDNRGKDYAGSSDTNAAISGARFHMEKHGTKNETQARRISMPKNRIGPEMLPEEFTMSIETMPRSHRYTISGIKIEPYQSSAEQAAKQLLEQAKMKILNAACTNEELWSSFGWEYENYEPKSREARDQWKIIRDGLEATGFKRNRVKPDDGPARHVWQHIGNSL